VGDGAWICSVSEFDDAVNVWQELNEIPAPGILVTSETYCCSIFLKCQGVSGYSIV
jgi:hypothetical protein